MSQDQALLRAIIDSPDDDAARLVYADWLEEHGQSERAEFIRVQIHRENLPADDAERSPLREREREILAQHEDAWRRELPRLSGVNWHRFWRGFVSGADVACWKHFRRGYDSLCSATPVQFLRVFSISVPQIRELLQMPLLRHLRGLGITTSEMTDDGLLPFTDCPNLVKLRWLSFGGKMTGCLGRREQRHVLTERGIAVLLASPHLSGLSSLTFGWYSVSDEGERLLKERFGKSARVIR